MQRHRLVFELLCIECRRRARVRTQRKLVLLFARHFILARDVLSRESHAQVEIGIVIDEIRVGANDVSAHRNHRHRFQATGDDHLGPAGLDPVAAIAIDCKPDEQKRLIVIALVSTGRPARIAAARATFIPCSASGIAQPMITSSISDVSRPGTRAEGFLDYSGAHLVRPRRPQRALRSFANCRANC